MSEIPTGQPGEGGSGDVVMTDATASPNLRGGELPAVKTVRGEEVEGDGDASSFGGTSNYSVDLSIDHEDDGRTESSKTSDLETTPSSMSVSSSVYNFVMENGRSFHSYKEGKYFLPNDEKEQSRLDLQHAINKFLMRGKYGLAPLDNPKHVLDIGTGTGIWAIEFAEEFPNAQVLGTDLSPIQPDYLPPNCRFEIDDMEDEWAFSHKFDYIHGRYLAPFLKDFPHLFSSIYSNLVPGGWAELMEIVVCFRDIGDGTVEGTALRRWNLLLLEGIRKMGRSATAALRYKRWMEAAGFVNVQEKKFAVPMNTWAKGAEEKFLGAMQMANNLEGVEGLTMAVFTRALGWEPAAVEELLVEVKRDMRDRSIHGYLTIMVTWAQKPA